MGKIYAKNTWLDRIISGALRYDIKDNSGTSLYSQVQILLHNTVTQAGSALLAAWMNNIEGGVDAIDTLTADKLAPITLAGTSTAYTLTTIGASALTTGEQWQIIPNVTAGATPTLNRDGKGAKNLKYYDSTGTKQSCSATTFYANVPYKIQYDGTDYMVSGVAISGGSGGGVYPYMSNGKLSVTVASNNLSVALKTWAGADPSVGDPVTVFLGGAKQTITAALSVTVNAGAASGAGTFNAGSAELKTHVIRYSAYLGYNATDGVVIAISRIPHGRIYSDFSTTPSNEKYAAISTITHAAASDEYAQIGMFDATNSGTASYNWSVPTFTASNLIQYPRPFTDWMDWTPATSASGSLTWTSPTSIACQYRFSGNKIEFETTLSATLGGSADNTLKITLPFNGSQVGNSLAVGTCLLAGALSKMYLSAGTPNILSGAKYDSSNFATSGSAPWNGSGAYKAA
jgi:hypothetical protein